MARDATPRKNKLEDHVMLNECATEFRLTPGGQLQWTEGNTQDLCSPYLTAPPSRQCQFVDPIKDDDGGIVLGNDGETLGTPCHRWRLRLSSSTFAAYCSDHLPDPGEMAKRDRIVDAAARAALAESKLALVQELIAIALNPKAYVKDRLIAINSLLDRAGMKPVQAVDIQASGFDRLLDKLESLEIEHEQPE